MGAFDGLNGELASRIKQLIGAAQKAGYTVRPGSGYRTIDEQIQLRKANGCPDVWSSPASSCRVPTAIPGRSNHNHGLAMDLDYGTPEAAAWANANAGKFGLHFPVNGENWHVEMVGDDGSFHDVNAAAMNGAIGFDVNKMDEPQNPEDELAGRLHAVMRILGSGVQNITTPEDLADPTGIGSDVTAPEQQLGTQTATINPPGGDVADPNGFGAIARQHFGKFGWGPEEYAALVELWNRESGDPEAGSSKVTWNPHAQNPTSTAHGIAQFLNGTWAGVGMQKTDDPGQQIFGGEMYIHSRYGTPSQALAFHNQHGWY